MCSKAAGSKRSAQAKPVNQETSNQANQKTKKLEDQQTRNIPKCRLVELASKSKVDADKGADSAQRRCHGEGVTLGYW